LGQYGGHHQILGAGHCDHIGAQSSAFQALGTGDHIAVLYFDVGAQRGQPLDVLVDGALANGATPRQTDTRFAKAGQQGPQHKNGGAHGFDQVVGRFHTVNLGSAKRQGTAVAVLHVYAQLAQQVQGGLNVVQLGNVLELKRV